MDKETAKSIREESLKDKNIAELMCINQRRQLEEAEKRMKESFKKTHEEHCHCEHCKSDT